MHAIPDIWTTCRDLGSYSALARRSVTNDAVDLGFKMALLLPQLGYH